MTSTATVPATFLGARPSSAADSAEPWLRQGGTFKLDDWTASVRYEVDGIFCRVVTTVAPDPQAAGAPGLVSEGAPIRFAVTLAPGQRHTFALARPGRRRAPSVLEIVHTDDALLIEVVKPGARPAVQ